MKVKLYNPWKPHIIRDGHGTYFVRVMNYVSWKYYCRISGGFYFLRDWVVGYSSLKEAKTELVHAIHALHEKKEYERKSKKKDEVIFD